MPLRRKAEAVFGEPVPTCGVPLHTRAPLPRRPASDGAGRRRPRTRTEANAHTANERLPLADLRKATDVVALTLLDLLRGR